MTRVFEIPPRPRPPMRWRRALRALSELLEDQTDAVDKAQDLTFAIGARAAERQFQRFARSAAGRRLIEERPVLLDRLRDRTTLQRMPADSFGRAYLDYLETNGFDPAALIALRHRTHDRWVREEGMPSLDPLRAWFHDRTMLSHDLMHALTEYPTDGVGEATLLAFSLGQLASPAGAMLTAGAAHRIYQSLGFRWLVYDFWAWRRGRRAERLATARWEELLPQPLDEVRARLRIAPTAKVHPGGILHDTPLEVATQPG